MLVKTSPVQVLLRAAYSNEDDPDPIRWGARAGSAEGQLIEKLMILDPATGSIMDNLTLDPSINGGVQNGDIVSLTCEVTREQKPAYSRGGREYVAVKDKWRVVKVESAPAASVKSNAE